MTTKEIVKATSNLKNLEVLMEHENMLKLGYDGTPDAVTHLYKKLGKTKIEMRTTHAKINAGGSNHDYTIVDFTKKS